MVPARDAHALGQALHWHFENREAARAMGRAARRAIDARFTAAHYKEHMISFYKSPAERSSQLTSAERSP